MAPRLVLRLLVVLPALMALFGCGHEARISLMEGYGPEPALPAPDKSAIPLVHIAPAVGWPTGAKPNAAPGLKVERFAQGLDHPRWIYVLPNGDVLVAETNAPPKPEDGKGPKGLMMKLVMKKAGSGMPAQTVSRFCAMPPRWCTGISLDISRWAQLAVRDGARRQ